jgi:hypothetical protein
MPAVIPTPTGARPAASPAERAFSGARRHADAARQGAAAAARGLKDARNALDSAIAQHGPGSPITDAARVRWAEARKGMEQAQQHCEAAEAALERALKQWAKDAAQQHQPSRVARRFPPEADSPPGEAEPPCAPRD